MWLKNRIKILFPVFSYPEKQKDLFIPETTHTVHSAFDFPSVYLQSYLVIGYN